MNEKNYKKRLDFQQSIISKKSEEVECLKLENERLKLELQKKDEIISSIEPMRNEMLDSIRRHRKLTKEYKDLIQELRKMKKIMNQEVYHGKWWLVKWLIK